MLTLAERIRWVLTHRNVSARKLSLKAGLSQSHVGQLARGQLGNQVSGPTLVAIAQAAGVDPMWLQTGEGSPEPAPEEERPDPAPHRTEAARLAREDGVFEAAVLGVLAEDVTPETASRSVLWWALRMKGREVELLQLAPGSEGHQDAPPPPTQRVKRTR
jgi:transcriptional regulator with XRE-family HTH domain